MSRRSALVAKRILDATAATTFLVLGSPIMGLIALAVKLDSLGPVFFRQVREGRNGQPFTILKFRTMVLDPDDRQPVSSLDDARVTKIGRFLRRSSLDELPQLINVVVGDMSLVGPRPQLIGTTRRDEMRRLDMRPGMTGLVEVSDPQTMTWDERMALDVEYVERWNFALDLSILIRTVPVMFARKNAVEPPRT